MKVKILNSVLVGIGGAVGSMIRYLVALMYSYDPHATFAVNIIGSFILGFLTIFLAASKRQKNLKLLLGTGFCGGFTTMSTFCLELTTLSLYAAFIYLVGTIGLSLALALFGMRVANKIVKREAEL